jgi:hypothetical protein
MSNSNFSDPIAELDYQDEPWCPYCGENNLSEESMGKIDIYTDKSIVVLCLSCMEKYRVRKIIKYKCEEY